MSSQTTAQPTLSRDAQTRADAIARYEAALVKAQAATTTEARNKANGALSGPLQAIRNAEARMFESEEAFEPYQAEGVGKRDVWNEAEAREALAKVGSAWKRATGSFEYLRATYDTRIDKALKAAKKHGVSLDDPRK